jgi:micrococcal nuclease
LPGDGYLFRNKEIHELSELTLIMVYNDTMDRRYLRTILAALILLAAFCFICHAQPSSVQKLHETSVRVVRVHDGDTVSAVFGQKTEKVRLLGIDAPEMGQRPWGAKAKRHLEGLLKRSEWSVSLEFDIVKRDKYGRLLAYLRGKDNKLINLEMVEDGYAVLFTLPPNVKYADELRNSQRLAREKGLGIWGKDGLKEMPLDYKKTHPR